MFKRHKYGAVKTEIDGIKFDSKLESRFYKYFRDSDIEILELQPVFVLQEKFRYNGKGIRDIRYIPDFKIKHEGDIYYVDSKGMSDSVFKMKHKMWLKKFGDDNILIVSGSIKDFKQQIAEA